MQEKKESEKVKNSESDGKTGRTLAFAEDLTTKKQSITFTGPWSPMLLRKVMAKLMKELKKYKIQTRQGLKKSEAALAELKKKSCTGRTDEKNINKN